MPEVWHQANWRWPLRSDPWACLTKRLETMSVAVGQELETQHHIVCVTALGALCGDLHIQVSADDFPKEKIFRSWAI